MAVASKGPAGSEVLELSAGDAAAVSSGTTVRIRANSGSGAAEVSAFGGAYVALGGGGGSVLLPPKETTYSFANNLAGSGSTSMGSFSSFTQGVSIMPLRERVVVGVRFWCDLPSPDDFKVSLWESAGATRVADGTAAVPAGAGFYQVNFSTPYTITASDVGLEFRVTIYHVSGTSYPRATTAGGFMPATPYVAGVYIQSDYNLFSSGDAYPSSVAGEFYIVEPVFEKVTP